MTYEPRPIAEALTDGMYAPGWYYLIAPRDLHRGVSSWAKANGLSVRQTHENRETGEQGIGETFYVLRASREFEADSVPQWVTLGLYRVGLDAPFSPLEAAHPYMMGTWEQPPADWIHTADEVAVIVQDVAEDVGEGLKDVAKAAGSGMKTAGFVIGFVVVGGLAYSLLRK